MVLRVAGALRISGTVLTVAAIFLPWYVGERSWSGCDVVGRSVRELSRLAHGITRTHAPNDPLWGASGVIVVLGPSALALTILALGLRPGFGVEAARSSAWIAISLFASPLLITTPIAELEGFDGPIERWAVLGVLLVVSFQVGRLMVHWNAPPPAACLTAAALLGMCLPLVGFPLWSYEWGGGGVVDPGGIVSAIGMALLAGGTAWGASAVSNR